MEDIQEPNSPLSGGSIASMGRRRKSRTSSLTDQEIMDLESTVEETYEQRPSDSSTASSDLTEEPSTPQKATRRNSLLQRLVSHARRNSLTNNIDKLEVQGMVAMDNMRSSSGGEKKKKRRKKKRSKKQTDDESKQRRGSQDTEDDDDNDEEYEDDEYDDFYYDENEVRDSSDYTTSRDTLENDTNDEDDEYFDEDMLANLEIQGMVKMSPRASSGGKKKKKKKKKKTASQEGTTEEN